MKTRNVENDLIHQTHTHTHTHIHIHAHTHTYIHTYTYTHTHAHMHVRTYLSAMFMASRDCRNVLSFSFISSVDLLAGLIDNKKRKTEIEKWKMKNERLKMENEK